MKNTPVKNEKNFKVLILKTFRYVYCSVSLYMKAIHYKNEGN